MTVREGSSVDAQVRVTTGEGVLLHELGTAFVLVDKVLSHIIGQATDNQELAVVEGNAACTVDDFGRRVLRYPREIIGVADVCPGSAFPCGSLNLPRFTAKLTLPWCKQHRCGGLRRPLA